MRKRPTLASVLLASFVLVGLAFGTGACGSAGGTPSTAAASVTTTTQPSTGEPGGTATTGSATLPSIQVTPEVQTYLQQMQAWLTAMAKITPEDAADDPLKITDVSKVTDAQVGTAETMAAQAHAALDQLNAITPPAALTAFQQMLVSIISSAVDATDKTVAALKDRDQAALDAARARGDQLEAQLTSLMEELAPLLMGGTATS